MFNKNMEKGEGISAKETETIIGPSVVIKGNFNCQGNIIIEGELDGKINTEGDLNVGDKAKIKADIKAKNANIDGQVFGNIQISGYLEIGSTAKIIGDISAQKISIVKGAIFNGKCDMSGNVTEAIEAENKS